MKIITGYWYIFGLSMAASAMVARRIGEKDPEEAAMSGAQAIIIGLLISPVTGIAGWIMEVVRVNVIIRQLKVADGGPGQFLIASASWIVLMRYITDFGS